MRCYLQRIHPGGTGMFFCGNEHGHGKTVLLCEHCWWRVQWCHRLCVLRGVYFGNRNGVTTWVSLTEWRWNCLINVRTSFCAKTLHCCFCLGKNLHISFYLSVTILLNWTFERSYTFLFIIWCISFCTKLLIFLIKTYQLWGDYLDHVVAILSEKLHPVGQTW